MRESVEVLFAKLDPEASAPTQGSKSAAGWDLRALEETTVRKGTSAKIRTGLAVAIPEGWEGQIRSRSSLGAKGMIMPNGVGTIDSDYRGELMVLATWIGEGDEIVLAKGERIGLIRFGSRVDIYLPLNYQIKVNQNDIVAAGKTIIAER